MTQQLQKKVSEPEAPGDDVDMEANFKDDLPAMEGPAAQQRSDDQTFDEDDYEPNGNSESAGGPDGEPEEYAPAIDEDDWDQFDIGLMDDSENATMSSIVDSLVAARADRHCSRIYAATVKGSRKEASFVELYGRGSIMTDANLRRRNLNVQGLAALDLRTVKEDGTPWNFSNKKDRREAERLIDELNPTWIVGSPPCTAFSQWNVCMNYPKMDPAVIKRLVAEGQVHLDFVAKLDRKQYNCGRHFFH